MFKSGDYKLSSLAKRLTKYVPENEHYAESDVLTLIQCALSCNVEFVDTLEKNCYLFSDVKKF